MRTWWTDDPNDPDVRSADDPDVRALVEQIAPGSPVSDLGGCFSLNLRLHDLGLVLRVQQPFVSRGRVLAMRELRRGLLARGLLTASPRSWHDRDLLSCRGRWSELESFVPHEKPDPTWASYRWMYRGMGRLHRTFADLDPTLPRPVVATYAAPRTLRRWLAVTGPAAAHDEVAEEMARLAGELLPSLAARWTPATALPTQVVHGDVRLGNVGLTSAGETVYLDFGFAATRPRIHDLAYSLAWILLRPDNTGSAEAFPWQRLPELLGEYEDAAETTLSDAERRALPAYVAAVPMYHVAVAGYTADPVAKLHEEAGRRSFLRIAKWLLAHPDVSFR
ncbi:phosphotransferase enzyme family protein [Actinopolymorpha pittospori]|uniref:Ser/Thr protein kinase RdoA (MazF antagonist) n=1 Tax=Actinopolymorpha pittospori TaxID=648752 RepID=A0A927NA68_9ACTN|nr:phosphotransferase [Actinopolymorpha pittospori]MBE1613063.1 Ser/Thr protein kinase RdoA (MazF antagonist) [Actinopolymorpha pittospori]